MLLNTSHLNPPQAAQLPILLPHMTPHMSDTTLGNIQAGQVHTGQQGQVWGADQVIQLQLQWIVGDGQNKYMYEHQ